MPKMTKKSPNKAKKVRKKANKELNVNLLSEEEIRKTLPKDNRPNIKFQYSNEHRCYYYNDPNFNFLWVVKPSKRTDPEGNTLLEVEGLSYYRTLPKRYKNDCQAYSFTLNDDTKLEVCPEHYKWNSLWIGNVNNTLKHPRLMKSNLTEVELEELLK